MPRLSVRDAAQLPVTDSIEFGRLRVLCGLYQRDIARLFGVSTATVHRWESGGNIPTPTGILMRLLAAEQTADA